MSSFSHYLKSLIASADTIGN